MANRKFEYDIDTKHVRCLGCSGLLAKLNEKGDGVEIKCRKCKKISVIKFKDKNE